MSGSSFFDALTDPAVSALLGASQGFAAAAMPQRMPTPWGAAIGMGAGGALSGIRESQITQLARARAQAEGMQNQVTAAGLPAALAQGKYMADLWSHPEQVQQMMNGTTGGMPAAPAAAPPSPQASPNLISAALSSLPDDKTRSIAVNTLLSSGLPQSAWAPWISSIHNESGWNLNAPDGKAGEIGPGQVMPDTGKMVGYTPDQLRVPENNLMASAKYFGKQYAAAGGDPAKAFAGYNTGSIEGNAPDYVHQGMGRLGQWGYADSGAAASLDPASGAPITPQTAMVKAQDYIQQANQLERQQQAAKFFQSKGMPVMAPPGDPAVLRQQAMEYTKLALAEPTSAATTQGKSKNELQLDRYGNAYQMGPDNKYHYLGRGPEVKEAYFPPKPGSPAHFGYNDVGAIGIGAQPPVGGGPGLPTEGVPLTAGMAPYKAGLEVQQHSGIIPPPLGSDMGGAAPVPPQAVPPQATSPQAAPAPGGAPPINISIPGSSEVSPEPTLGQPTNIAPGIASRPIPGGGSAITDTRKAQEDAYQKDLLESHKLEDELQSTQQGQVRTLEMRNVIAQLPQTGPLGTQRAAVSSFIQTYMPNLAPAFNNESSLLPNATPAAILAKLQLQTAGLQEREAVGARGGARLTEMYKNANPNLDMVPNANREIANLQAVAQQADMDYGRGLQSYITQHGNNYLTGKSDYLPSSNFDSDWLKQRNPQVYLGATLAMSGRPYDQWAKGLDHAEIGRALDVVKRIDPTSKILAPDGTPHMFPQATK